MRKLYKKRLFLFRNGYVVPQLMGRSTNTDSSETLHVVRTLGLLIRQANSYSVKHNQTRCKVSRLSSIQCEHPCTTVHRESRQHGVRKGTETGDQRMVQQQQQHSESLARMLVTGLVLISGVDW